MSVETPTVTIAELRVDDPREVEASFALQSAARIVDVPDFPPLSRRYHAVGLRLSPPGNRTLRWLAWLDGAPAGELGITLPTLDNLQNVDVDLTVHPEFRRRGVGRALYERAVRAAHDEGRHRLFGATIDALPGGAPRHGAGSAFATSIGATAALTDVRRRLDLADVDTARHDQLLSQAWARAGGYSLVQWSATTPEDVIDDVARLDARLLVDAPMGDLDWEPEQIDAGRVRAGEAVRAEKGVRAYSTGVRLDATGRLVAFTALTVLDGVREHAWQQITLVDPDHRGHRLGMVTKIENLRYTVAAEPGLRVIDTWNADVNDHMIRINDAIGFRPVDAMVNWQIEV